MKLDIAYGFAAAAHRGQKRKYTGDAYVTHCVAVVQILQEAFWLSSFDKHRALLAAMLHDTIEDTPVTADDISEIFDDRIAGYVLEVTDVSKPQDGNRAVRKLLDLEHLAKGSFIGQTIKCADIIDNTRSIAKHDLAFAKVYIPEKLAILKVFKHAEPNLLAAARKTVEDAARLIAKELA